MKKEIKPFFCTYCDKQVPCGCDKKFHLQEPIKEDWEDKTPSQIKYYKSMVGKSGKEAPRWKGENAGKSSKHKWLDIHYGKPDKCENPYCEGRSGVFEWCLKTGRKYTHNRKDYLRLCRSCHRKYDWSDEKKKQAIKNLWWATGSKIPNLRGVNQYSKK